MCLSDFVQESHIIELLMSILFTTKCAESIIEHESTLQNVRASIEKANEHTDSSLLISPMPHTFLYIELNCERIKMLRLNLKIVTMMHLTASFFSSPNKS